MRILASILCLALLLVPLNVFAADPASEKISASWDDMATYYSVAARAAKDGKPLVIFVGCFDEQAEEELAASCYTLRMKTFAHYKSGSRGVLVALPDGSNSSMAKKELPATASVDDIKSVSMGKLSFVALATSTGAGRAGCDCGGAGCDVCGKNCNCDPFSKTNQNKSQLVAQAIPAAVQKQVQIQIKNQGTRQISQQSFAQSCGVGGCGSGSGCGSGGIQVIQSGGGCGSGGCGVSSGGFQTIRSSGGGCGSGGGGCGSSSGGVRMMSGSTMMRVSRGGGGG